MFVSMLTASTGARIPFDLEVTIVEGDFLNGLGIHDGDCDSRGVNSTSPLSGRYALNSVTAWLVIEL